MLKNRAISLVAELLEDDEPRLTYIGAIGDDGLAKVHVSRNTPVEYAWQRAHYESIALVKYLTSPCPF